MQSNFGELAVRVVLMGTVSSVPRPESTGEG